MQCLNLIIVLKVIILQLLTTGCSISRGPFDDNVLYTFKWPGKIEINPELTENNIIKVSSSDHEKYTCILPDVSSRKEDLGSSYVGGSGLQLIEPLFLHSACAYRFEIYWTYEICHGKHVRQYHEDRGNKIITTQEYYLGRWDIKKWGDLTAELEAKEKNLNYKMPVKQIEGISIPYLQINYTDGTLCDLSGKPRQTNVLYMCYETGRHDFYSIKEIATCHYELIVLTSFLCRNPRYKPINTEVNEISCIPIDKAPIKPKNFLKNEAQVLKREIEKLNERVSQRLQASLSLESVVKDMKFVKSNDVPLFLRPHQPKSEVENISELLKSPKKPVPVEKVFTGEECIIEGTGWWKYRFCYGKFVEQFHTEKDNTETVIRLGNFDLDVHKSWYTRNLFSAKKSDRVTHFYAGGARCDDMSNIHRSTEVVFKCVDHQPSISMTLSEPRVCSYVLELESEYICTILSTTDENGLFQDDLLEPKNSIY